MTYRRWEHSRTVEHLVGLVFASIAGAVHGDEMAIVTDQGRRFVFYHDQDCCETVQIDDIVGDLSDLICVPILQAEEVTSSNTNPEGVPVPEYQESYTWTFYKFATIKGSVTVRWYGESNGHYSESVSLAEEFEE